MQICDRILKLTDNERMEWSEQEYESLIEGFALLSEIIEADLLPVIFNVPKVGGTISEDCSTMAVFLREVHTGLTAEASKLRVKSLRTKYRLSLGTGFSYEFSQGDLDRVQHLINELRKEISNTDKLGNEHQQRILQRLEKLQSELHKRVSDLDRFWGLVGEAGVVAAKLGNDAKPIVERIREIAGIFWQTQARAEELPSGTKIPMLDHEPPDKSDKA